jgi:hypothetical protein
MAADTRLWLLKFKGPEQLSRTLADKVDKNQIAG